MIEKTVKTDSIKPHPRNYKKHPEDQLNHLVESIKEYGIYRDIIISSDDYILAGEGVWMAAKLSGFTEINIKQLDVKHDDIRALKLMAIDNEVSHLSFSNQIELATILKEINELDVEKLLGTGYDEMMLSALILNSRNESEIPNINSAKEWLGLPEYDEYLETIKLHLTFESEKDRDDCLLLLNLPIEPKSDTFKKTVFYNWPNKPKKDKIKLKFNPKNE
jgi:hypothetical protein